MANRVCIGQKSGSQYGIYISKAGKNVLTATNPEDFLLNSDLAGGSVIHASGTLTRGATASFPALPYTPIVLSWGINKSNGRQVGRIQWSTGYIESWYNSATSELETEEFSVKIKGPLLRATPSSVTFRNITTPNFVIPDNWNARYIVLRVPV